MNIISTGISEVVVIEPQVFSDGCGCFLETYQSEKYQVAGTRSNFI